MNVRNHCIVCGNLIDYDDPQVQRKGDSMFMHYVDCRPPTIEEHQRRSFEHRTEERLMAIEKRFVVVDDDMRRIVERLRSLEDWRSSPARDWREER